MNQKQLLNIKWSTRIGFLACLLTFALIAVAIYRSPVGVETSAQATGPDRILPTLRLLVMHHDGGSHHVEGILYESQLLPDEFIENSLLFVFPQRMTEETTIRSFGSVFIETIYPVEDKAIDIDSDGVAKSITISTAASSLVHVLFHEYGHDSSSRYAVLLRQGEGGSEHQIMAFDFDELDQAPDKLKQAVVFAIQLNQEQYKSRNAYTGEE